MDYLALLLNKAKMDVTEEVIDIIPGGVFGFHAVWENGQFFNILFGHIFTDISFHETNDHECNKVEKRDGFDSVYLFDKNRSNLENGLRGVHSFFQVRLILLGPKHF